VPTVAASPLLAPERKPYRPIGAILEMFKARDRELVVEGPADTGKSRGCIEKVHGCCEKYPGARWAFIRKTRKSLRTTAQVTYERWVCPAGASRLWGDEEYRYPNGSRIYLLGMDDPDKVQSMELDGAFFQQAEESEVDDWEILSKCITGRGATMPYVQLLADMNPTFPDFHLYKREAEGHVRFIQVRHEDNPSITPERLAALDALTGHRYKRLRLGLRVAAEGMFFTEWDPERHLCEPFEIPWHWTRWTATDYGYADPFAHYAFARDPDTKRVYVYREAYKAELRAEVQARLVTTLIKREREAIGGKMPAGRKLYQRHVGDPSMFATRHEYENLPSLANTYKANGLALEPAVNNRIHGWQVVRAALNWQERNAEGEMVEKPPRLQVFRGRCPNLERTLPAMVHDPLDPEDLADKVNGQKTEDHAVDALRYGLMAEAVPSPGHARDVRFG
jgi:phage terminase large subunit